LELLELVVVAEEMEEERVFIDGIFIPVESLAPWRNPSSQIERRLRGKNENGEEERGVEGYSLRRDDYINRVSLNCGIISTKTYGMLYNM
jgi:hypothetical protein